MARKDVLKTVGFGVLLIFAGILVGILITNSGGNTAMAADQPEVYNAPESPEATDAFHACTPHSVAIYNGRIHVRCTSPAAGGVLYDDIWYFVVSTADSRKAARNLSMMMTAQVSGKTLGITFSWTDLSGAAIGCQIDDCRLISYMSMY